MTCNVHIYAYGDGGVKDAIRSAESVLPEAHVYVIDGRYANFPKVDCFDITPGLESFCEDRPNVSYHAPPTEELPYGEQSETFGGISGQVEKARFTNYEVLPQDEWSIKLDSDERLERFDVNLDSLDRTTKYFPAVTFRMTAQQTLPRLWVPGNWTFLMNDCSVPRDVLGRAASNEDIMEAALDIAENGEGEALTETCLPGFCITNDESTHGPEYLESRVYHLVRLGRFERSVELIDEHDLDIDLPELMAEAQRFDGGS